jgi:hypothetical protein
MASEGLIQTTDYVRGIRLIFTLLYNCIYICENWLEQGDLFIWHVLEQTDSDPKHK